MNGEMHQICCIVAAGKRALQYGEPIQYTPAQYENAITFSCLPGKLFSETKRCIAPRIETWFEFLQSKGLQDIALACPTDVTDKTILGFSNTTESSVLCFYQSGETSYFAPNWQFDPEKRLWNTEYSEYRCPDSPSEKPRFENNTDSFRQALKNWLFKSGVKVLPIFSILRKIFWTVSENIRIKNTDCNCRRYRMKNFKSSRQPVWPMYSAEWDRGTTTRSARHKTWDWIKNIKPFPTSC